MGIVDDGPSQVYVCPHDECDKHFEIHSQFGREGSVSVRGTHGGESMTEVGECGLCHGTLPLTDGSYCSPECADLGAKVRERIFGHRRRILDEPPHHNS
ncbi:hypothetical protein LCGC14_1550140 [marine sediment metagenome]|uniref:Uncharacterized protein n=1 Tax=marine sediment metagenome TaxID=412755 RepID=A0A0F9IQG4_9ZZZZ